MTKCIKYIIGLFFIIASLTVYDRSHLHDVVEPAIKHIAKSVDPRQLLCMTSNIVYEAKNESLHGQAAVARVVMNRINHGFASTPCEVIHQKTVIDKGDTNVIICQFSWSCDTSLSSINKHSVTYKNAERIAYEVLAYDGFKNVVPSNALFFHNTSVNPNWPYKVVATIDNHIFYSKQKKTKNEQDKN